MTLMGRCFVKPELIIISLPYNRTGISPLSEYGTKILFSQCKGGLILPFWLQADL